MKSGKASVVAIIVLGVLGIMASVIYAESIGINISLFDAIFGNTHSVKLTTKSAEVTPISVPQKNKEKTETESSKKEIEIKSQKPFIQKKQSTDIFIKENTLEKLIKSYNANPTYWENHPAIFKKIEENKKNKQITVLIDFADKSNMIYTYKLNDSYSKIIEKINPEPKHIVDIDNWEEEWEKNLIVYFPEERKINTPNGQLQSKIPKISEKNYKDKLNIDNAYGYIYTKEGQFFITHYSYYTTFKTNVKNPIWIYKLRGQ